MNKCDICDKLITYSDTYWSWDKYYIQQLTSSIGYTYYEVTYKDFGIVFLCQYFKQALDWIKKDNGDTD